MSDQFTELRAESSILFLGSGFSAGAVNIGREPLPMGNPLKEKLAKALRIDPADYDLRTIVEEFTSREDVNLYEILYNTFTVRTPLPAQRDILSLNWSRVYTTNYDDLVESVMASHGKQPRSFNFDSLRPKSLPRSFVVHLHGCIREASEQNVLSQLVLNEASYIRHFFEKSPWFEEFRRDMQFCDSCYFIGYSLADYHISALLSASIDSRTRTYFITSSTPDRIFVNRANQYGVIKQIGRDGFAKLCRELPRSIARSDYRTLHSFKLLDAHLDNKPSNAATPNEVFNLVAYGKFSFTRYISSFQASNYVVGRKSSVKQAETVLWTSRTLIVHSRLGNGKTIFLAILAQRLTSLGFRCLQFRGRAPHFDREVESLQDLEKVVLLFDDYDAAVENVEALASRLPKVKFVITVRSGRQEVRFHEIVTAFPPPLARVGIDTLDTEDKDDLRRLLNQSGVYSGRTLQTVDVASEMREVVSALYDHQEIRQKITEALAPILLNRSFKAVFISSHLIKWAGLDLDAAFLNASSGADAYAELSRYREIATDLFLIDDERLVVRSSLLSTYLLEKVLSTEDIVEQIHDLVIAAAERKQERRYRALMSELMKVSSLRKLLSSKFGYETQLERYYAKLSSNVFVNAEPLFWLQYAILMADSNRLDLAERFLDTSYERAEASPNFKTFQIDTVALRVLLSIETESPANQPISRFEAITEVLQTIRPMVTDESHRGYAISVLKHVEPFVSARAEDFSTIERAVLEKELGLLTASLGGLSIDLKTQTGSETVRHSLQRSVHRLKSA